MSLSMALRQAAIDIPANLPSGARFAYTYEQGKGGALTVVVKAKNVAGFVVWEQAYDHRGHRVTVGGAIDF